MLLINALSGRHSFLATAILVGLIGCLFVDTVANAMLTSPEYWTSPEPEPDPIEPTKEPVEHTVCDTNLDEQMTDHVCHVLVSGEIKEGKPCCARKKFKKEKFCRKKVNRVGHNALNEKAKVNLAKAFRCIVVLLQSLSGVVTPETMDCCTHLRIGKKFPVCKKIGASTPPPSPDLSPSTSLAPTPPGGSRSTSLAPTTPGGPPSTSSAPTPPGGSPSTTSGPLPPSASPSTSSAPTPPSTSTSPSSRPSDDPPRRAQLDGRDDDRDDDDEDEY